MRCSPPARGGRRSAIGGISRMRWAKRTRYSARDMKLLLSDFALRTWGKRIEQADGSLSFVTAEQALAADGPTDVDIAFMTREVTGRSSKDNMSPELKGFEAVMRKSPGL